MGMRRASRKKFKFLKPGVEKDKILSVILAVTIIFLSSLIIFNFGGNDAKAQGLGAGTTQPTIEYLGINTFIDNNYAITNIMEKFANPYDHAIDETFQFQIPAKAFISNFSLTIDNHRFYSEIVSSSIGKEKYNAAVVKGTNAGLVEAKDKNIFTYSVSLAPKEYIIVCLRYEQFIEKSLGGYEYVIPFSGASFGSNIKDFEIDITVKSKLNIGSIEAVTYPEMSNISYLAKTEGKVLYNATACIPQQDFIINYELSAPPINGTMLNYNDGIDEYFLHIFSPQRSDLGDNVMPKEIIFVLDKSGSMSGKKICQLKNAFEEIINQLRNKDTFNIIMFDSNIEKYKSKLITANEENKAKAVKYIDDILAGGCTNINNALETALDMFTYSETKMPIIVMLTDGLPTVGETNTKTIRNNIKTKNEARVSLYCLGFGFDLDFNFLKAMSLENFGIAIRIYENEDASIQITDFYDTISTPLLRGLTFSYSDSAYEIYPTYVEQLFEGTEIVVVGKYNGSSRYITSSVKASTAKGSRRFTETFKLEEFVDNSFSSTLSAYGNFYTLPINLTDNNHIWSSEVTKYPTFINKEGTLGNSFIPRFWAYAKLRFLLDEIAVSGENESLVENVTELALEYSFVTPYTSLLVDIESQSEEPSEEPAENSDSTNSGTNSGNDNNGYNSGYDSGFNGGSEGEAESESESESEAEGESVDEQEIKKYKYNEGCIFTKVIDKSEAEDTYDDLEKKAINDKNSKKKSKTESEVEAESKHGELIWLTISITNNKNQCNIYWLGIHFDWQADNEYYASMDISSKEPKSIASGTTEYFNIYLELPEDIQPGDHDYHILFQYKLQAGVKSFIKKCYWQSKTANEFKINVMGKIDPEHSEFDLNIGTEENNNETVTSSEPLLPLVPDCETKVSIEDKNELVDILKEYAEKSDLVFIDEEQNIIKKEIEDDANIIVTDDSIEMKKNSNGKGFSLILILIFVCTIITSVYLYSIKRKNG